MNIKERAYQIASVNMKNKCSPAELEDFAEALVAPAAYIFKPNNELLWPHEVDQNVFASDQEDYDLLYTTPQPDQTAELEQLHQRVAELEERRCEVCGYAEHHREHTGSLRNQVSSLKTELREICAAIDDPASDLTLTTVECIKRLKAENESLRKDGERLAFLDTNARFAMGWKVGAAPMGNLSITSVIKPTGKVTSIREAIDAAMKGEQG